ncbi:hypothetical protein E4V42_13610 [Clostridium estertheticum]|uniref:Uncharacterized protein n=1 Tax=Clostridium estertheticum TaxID=238834 RepID=A0A5N7J310_9CLOT|nr:hypothetical protein [Clostridium estertheticum]MPQ32467.1 hypothetical protein [Clostridium estertheticum]MPQ63126.1 hypothetical protein [Clostridium estertheticum]
MKYTVQGFSQNKIVGLGLDVVDTMLLRYFIDFKDSGSMSKEIFEGETYYWINYKNVIKELPILKLNKADSIYRRFKKMADVNILEHKTKKEKGTFSFYKVGAAYLQLVSDSTDINPKLYGYKSRPGTDINPDPYGYKSRPGTDLNPEQKINLLNNQSIKYIYTVWNSEKIIEHKKLTDKLSRVINNSLRDYKQEEIVQAITNYKKILIGANYYFNYKWTLEDFLKRGLEKFLEWEVCSSNFKNKENSFITKVAKANAGAYKEI